MGTIALLDPLAILIFVPAQDTIGFLACNCTLPFHAKLFNHHWPQVFLLSAALYLLSIQPVSVFGIKLAHVQGLALALVNHALFAWAHLSSLSSLPRQHLDHMTQLDVICKHVKDLLNPTAHVTNKDIKWFWSLYRTMRDTNCHWSLPSHCASQHIWDVGGKGVAPFLQEDVLCSRVNNAPFPGVWF